jgi:hypothetical protein
MPDPADTTYESDATLGSGTAIAYSADGNTYTSVLQVVSIKAPKLAIPKVDKTHLLSPNKAREKRPGLLDLSECEMKLIFKSAAYAILHGFAIARTTLFWKMTYPDGEATGSTRVWRGFITGIEDETEIEDNIMATVTVEGTDIPVFTPAT